MEDGGGNVAGQPGQVFIGFILRAGFPFLGLVPAQRRLRNDAARDAQAVGRHLAILGGAEVAGGDGGRVLKAARLDLHAAPAGGVEVAHAGREGRKAVQRLTKGIERQRLHVVFDVGPGLVGAAAREGAQLRGRHAHGSAAFEGVFQPDLGLAPQRVGHGVERFHALHLEHGADLQVVLQVGAHAGQVVHHVNAMLAQ